MKVCYNARKYFKSLHKWQAFRGLLIPVSCDLFFHTSLLTGIKRDERGEIVEGIRLHRATVYEWMVGLFGLGVAVYYLPSLVQQNVLVTLFLFVLAILLEVFPVPLGKVYSSLLIAMPVAVSMTYGTAEAIWLMVVAELVFPSLRRATMKLSVRIFNAGQYALSVWVMVLMMQPFAGNTTAALNDWQTYLQVLLGFACFALVNHALIHFLQFLWGQFDPHDILNLLTGEGINILIALPFALLLMAIAPSHPLVAPFVLVPIVLLGHTIGLHQRTNLMQQIYRVTGQLTSEFDLDRISQSVAETAAKLTYAEAVMILITEPGTESPVFLPSAVHPLEEATNLNPFRENLVAGVVGQALLQPEYSYVPDLHKAGATQEEREGPYLSVAVFPMRSRQRVLGAIICYSPRPYAFGEMLNLPQTLANQVSVLIENARLYQALQEQTWRDGATGLHNYRFFYEALAHHVEQASRKEAVVSVVVVDVDYFKKFNDTYGHLAGDAVLHSLGKLMVEVAGPKATVARYGGEEFGLIFPFDAQDTYVRVEQIRTAVSHHMVEYEGYQLQGITVSIGIASYPEHGQSDRDLLLKADSAMYWGAKQRGRNHTALYSPEFDAQLFVDELTGLYTYHFINIRAREEIVRGVHQWGVVCLNVDRFSHVNEIFGFSVGDRALRELSLVIKEGVRQTELTCRFGGDEFLVLLPNTTNEELDLIADRIMKAVSMRRFDVTSTVTLSLRTRHSSAVLSEIHDVTRLFDQVGRLFADLHRVSGESLA